MSLTPNAVQEMVEGSGSSSGGFQPTLQVINMKMMRSSTTDRYRLILSDGIHFVNGMLATTQNHLIRNNVLVENALVVLEDFTRNIAQGKTVIVVVNLRVVDSPGQRIGEPVDYEKSRGPQGHAPPAPAVPAQPLYNSTNNQTPQGYPAGGGANPYGGGANPYGGGANPYGGGSNRSSMGMQSSAPIVRSMVQAPSMYTPISSLNMYNNRWTIQARVAAKTDIRTWSNARGEGSLFSVELLDKDKMDIRATFFKEAVDKFYSVLEVGKVYTFSGGRLKVANQQYNTCKSQYELTFDQNSEIHLDTDTGDIQEQTFDFIPIADVANVEGGKNVDIIGVVQRVGEVSHPISKKSGRELTKCDLSVVDDSATEINVTLWGEKASRAPQAYAGQPVVAFRHARVSDFSGKSLSAGDTVVIQPSIPEAARVLTWWQSVGSQGGTARSLSGQTSGGAARSLSERKCIASIKQENLGYSEAADYLSFKGTLSYFRKDKEGGAWYPACSNAGEPCKNRFKVSQSADGNWYCEKCQNTFPDCVRRWIFSAVVEDESSSTWVSFFNEQAETLMGGLTADEAFKRSLEAGNQDAYDSLFAAPLFTEWIFRAKVKNELVNDESRVKTNVQALHPVNYLQESKDLLAAIAQFN